MAESTAIAEAVAACRRSGDVVAAKVVLLEHWRALCAEAAGVAERDAETRRQMPEGLPMSGTNTLRTIEVIRNRFGEALPAIADWPDAGLALLDEPELERWQPTLIAQLVGEVRLRQAMIERAIARHRGNSEIVRQLIEIGAAERDHGLLDVAATLMPAGREWLVAWLANCYADLGDTTKAAELVVGALRQGSTEPLFGLLARTRGPVPEAAFEALAGMTDDHLRAATVTKLRELGYEEEAQRLAALLLTVGDGPKSLFCRPMLMATDHPMCALDLVEGIVRDAGQPLAIGMMMELAGFLGAVAIDETTSGRVRALAAHIVPRPMREEILARTGR